MIFFDAIVGKGEAIYHTAGALGDGERIWILAKLPDDIIVTDNDVVNKYLLLSNSHDGSSSVQIKFTPVRVVCQNTLSQALSDQNMAVKIPHIRNVHSKLADATDVLKIIRLRFDDLEASFKKMATISITDNSLKQYYDKVFPLPRQVKSMEDQRKQKAIEEMRKQSEYYFEEGKGNDVSGVRGTLWAAYNGITEYIDHHKKLNKATDKLNYIWFGSGYDVKSKAYKEAVSLLK